MCALRKIEGQPALILLRLTKCLIRFALPLLGLFLAVAADARSSSPHRASSRIETRGSRSVGAHTRSAARCQSCARDTSGRIARSTSARRAFRSYNPYPATGATKGPCAGYVDRSHSGLEAWRRRLTRQYAMANARGSESEGPSGIDLGHFSALFAPRPVKPMTLRQPQRRPQFGWLRVSEKRVGHLVWSKRNASAGCVQIRLAAPQGG